MPVDTPIETRRIHRSSSNRCSVATIGSTMAERRGRVEEASTGDGGGGSLLRV